MLGDLLGRGGMAEVFAGYSVGDHGFQKPVAIKRLLPELANDEVFVERLIEEAKLLVGMQHGQIVSVLDLAREGDDVFLVMEFVDGPSLRQLIKARGARGLSLGTATYIVQMAAAGLEFAHSRAGGAIIHADISPSNLLLTTSGEVRVADFGIARREGLGQGVVEGKWAYMAPEQARGESLTPRSDVFALGVVLYELLTGQHPFGRAVSASQRDDQMRVIPPRVVKPSIPHGLDVICMRALAHDPRDRYARMQAMIDALVDERFANGYREGASDLAQAIREVAPKSEASAASAPRTMHTERPITLMTRSLLREVTPAKRPSRLPRPPSEPSRPSRPAPEASRASRSSFARASQASMASGTPAYPMGPLDPPPRDAFPMQPTVGVQAMERIETTPPPRLGSSPVLGLGSSPAVPMLHPAAPAMGPGSGAHTVAREVDQVALAKAAQAAAAAMFQIPGVLRSDAPPLPTFRLSPAAMVAHRQNDDLGDELASVVGGHTMSGGGGAAASLAIEDRGNRWTIAVLAAAALAGVIAAVGFQLKSDHHTTEAPPVQVQPAPVAAPVEPMPKPDVVEPTPAPAPTIDTAAPAPAPAPTVDAAAPAPAAPTVDTPTVPAPAAPTVDTTAVPAPVAAPVATHDATATPAVPVAGAPVAAPAAPVAGKKPSAGRRRTDTGILTVDSAPWSWVTVGNKTMETPGKFYLAPGSYQVSFHNEKNGLVKTERVTIEAGKLKKLNERME